MSAPSIARHRRFFLAPLWLGALLVLALLAAAAGVYRSATTTTIIIVRHAESVLGSIADPPLAAEGEQRAQRLARMLGASGAPGRITAIYVTSARSAQQTATPLAARLGIQPFVLPDGATASTVASTIRSTAAGGAAVVVTSANVIPELVQILSSVQIAPLREDEYDGMYVVTVPSVGAAALLRLRY